MMSQQRGSIWFYLFLTVFLFGLLSFTVARMMRPGGDMGATERARLNAQSVLEYAQQAKLVVQTMRLDGVAAIDMQFMKEGEAGYTTAPHTDKVFHPEGGGLGVPNLHGIIDEGVTAPDAGPYMVRVSVEGVSTTSDDIVFSIRGVTQATCARLNKELTGSETIPSTGVNNHEDIFINSTTDITSANCASCVGKTNLCVSQSTPTLYTFYSVVYPH